MKKMLTGTVILSLVFAFSARAENGARGDWELAPEFGAGFPDHYAGLDPDPGFLIGLRFSYALRDMFSLEPSFHRVFSDAPGAPESSNFDSYRVNFLWNFNPLQTFRPFLTLGAGLERAHIPTSVEKDFAPNFGIGVKYYVSRFGGLRLEGRYIPVKVGGVVDDWENNFEAMATFFFTFPVKHEEKKVAVAPAPQATVAPVVVSHEADKDNDGVPDSLDKCPNTPTGTHVDATGCAGETKARGVLQGVNFKLGGSELTEDSKKVLDGVALELKSFPKAKIEVQGHTDTTGNEAANIALSQKRAQSVSDYLVGQGIPKEQLTAKGYGPSQPVADNKTLTGRKTNRRVEMKWLEN